MAMVDIKDLKKQILLQGLADEDCERLKAVIEPCRFGKGSHVYREGDPPGRDLYDP